MVSYRFPPYSSGGVFRTVKFVKYLPEHDWQPIVLTVKKSKFGKIDRGLLEEIPEITRIYKTRIFESKIYRYLPNFIGVNRKWYQIPDITVGWLPFAVLKAKKIIKKEKPDIIYSTSPPATSHLIALMLKKKTKLPWIADFRDPWTDSFIVKYPTEKHKKFEEKLEHKVLKSADKVICVTDPCKEQIIKKYPDLNKDKFVTITNGFDQDDFDNVIVNKSKKFTISHIGSFFGKQTPVFLLQAIKKAIDENNNLKQDLEVLFIGKTSKEYQNIAGDYGLEGILKQTDYIPHKQAIQYMLNSSCLFLIVGLGNKSEWIFPGKIFEYIASQTPVIATVPENSVVEDLIYKSCTGVVVKTDDVEEIKNIIIQYYNKWKNGDLKIKTDWEIVNRYGRKELTKKLVEQFNQISV